MDALLEDPQRLAAVAGLLLSLLWGFAPKLKVWFNGQDDAFKASLNGLVVLVLGVGVAYYHGLDPLDYAASVLWAGVGNQTGFGLLKRLR